MGLCRIGVFFTFLGIFRKTIAISEADDRYEVGNENSPKR